MIRCTKMATIIVAIALVLTSFPLMGQASNTNAATAGIYGNDVDDYMSYHDYSGVEFDKWFGYAGWNWNDKLSLGYATRKGSTYLGFLYNGYGVYTDRVKGELVNATYNNSDGSVDSVTYDTEFSNRDFYSDNSVTALIGLAGMGLKAGFRLVTKTYDEPDRYLTGTIFEEVTGDTIDFESHVESFAGHHNHYIPVLGWGMGLKSGSKTIKPYAELKLDFGSARYELIDSDYTTDYGVISLSKLSRANGTAGMDGYEYVSVYTPTGFNNAQRPKGVPSFSPHLTAGVVFGLSKFDLGFEYDMGMDIYFANSWGAFGITGDVKGAASWSGTSNVNAGPYSTTINESITATLYEKFGMTHVIAPSIYRSWDLSDRAKLGVAVKFPFYIQSERNDMYRVSTTTADFEVPTDPLLNYHTITVTRNYDGLEEVSRFSVDPKVSVGAQFAAIPDRFTLNAGVSCWPVSYSKYTRTISPNGYQTVTYKEYNSSGDLVTHTVTANLNAKADDSRYEEITWGKIKANVSAGFTLNFTSKFALDTEFNIYTGDFDVDLSKVNVLFTLKK